jgi:hypothetical protein
MKLKYLDVHNYHTLMPPIHGLSLAHRLDECLQGINEKQGELNGSIDALIRRNENTHNLPRGSQRLCSSPIEIAQDSNIVSRIINTRAIEKKRGGLAKLHTLNHLENDIIWKTIVPLQFLLKGWGDANSGHQCYIHTISHNMGFKYTWDEFIARYGTDSGDDYYYVGITSRNWLLRLNEHLGEMRRGSRKRFHTAWRESLGMKDIYFLSCLIDINLTYEDAMNWEEQGVDKIAYGPNGLNMIPGGFKGLKLLHELGISARLNLSLEERDKAIAEYIRRNPRKGIPHPFMAELWKDDEYYLKVIEARPKTLSPEQVKEIRELARMGRSITEIADTVGALNEVQVKNVIAGRTYGRMQ